MADKAKIDAQRADLLRRLGDDPKLAQVIASLGELLENTPDDEPRRRLKVPYANATALDKGTGWN